jgi:hypothetical protein
MYESPRRKAEDRELPAGDQEMPPRLFLVEHAHLFARHGAAQVGAEADGMRAVVVGFHDAYQYDVRPEGKAPNG